MMELMTHYITIIKQLLFFLLCLFIHLVDNFLSLGGNYSGPLNHCNCEKLTFYSKLNFFSPSTCYCYLLLLQIRSLHQRMGCGGLFLFPFLLLSDSDPPSHSLSVFFCSFVGCLTPSTAASSPSASRL